MATFQRHIETLFRHGTHAGLTDGDLLERFLTGPEERASAAFGTLVERHGPMVLRVCRRVLDDPHDAEDAAQAAFLVLARKARRIRRRDSVASWLFGVAVRVARKARSDNARRRRHERLGAEMAARSIESNGPAPGAEPPWADLYDELERLPERFRAPLVLCYLEGFTNEQAATRLGTSLRTLRRRLAEGRERLRVRLERRGVGPAGALLVATLAPESARSAAVPGAWADRTIDAALQFATTGAASGAAGTLATEVITSMFHAKLQLAATAVVVTGAFALAGVLTLAGVQQGGPEDDPAPRQAPVPPPAEAPVPVTIDGTPLPDFVTDRPRTNPGQTTQIRVTSAETGEPIPQATVRVWVEFQDYWTTTDEDGRITVEHNTGPADTWFGVDVWGDGFAMQRHTYGQRDEPIPEEATIKLQPGETLGGIVRDEQGRPVEGATVHLWSHNYQRKDPAELMFDLRATTGPDGRWQTGGAPESTGDPRGFYITHPDFISDRDFNTGHEPPSISELRAGTVVSVLKKGPVIEGRVLDAEGNPVEGAMVVTTQDPFSLDFEDFLVLTDADGHYRTGQLRPGDWHVLVRKPGHALAAQDVKIGTAVPQVDFRLGPPHPVRVRVLDEEGEPVVGAFVKPSSWRGYRGLGILCWTGDEGRVSWDWTPGDPILLNVVADGYLSIMFRQVPPTDEEIVVTLQPSLLLAGTVVDAESGEDIGRAEVEYGAVDPDTGEVAEWLQPEEASLFVSDGRLTAHFAAEADAYRIRITATGYTPFVSRTFEADEGAVYDYEVRLAPVEPVGDLATVLLPDGTPLANARVAVGEARRQGINLKDGDFVPEQMPNLRGLRTDAEGAFPIPALGERGMVFIVGDQGYAYASKPTLDESPKLQAQPFARVEGRYLIGDRPGANITLTLSGDIRDPETNGLSISSTHETTTDAEGRFTFERVIPTEDLRIARRDPEEAPNRVWTNGEVVRVEPGQAVDITYGGTGRPVLGRVAPPVDWTEPIDFTDNSSAQIVTNRPFTPYPPELFRGKTDFEGGYTSEWLREWLNSPEGQAYRAGMRQYAVTLAPDGSFRVDDVPPGEYRAMVFVGEEALTRNPGPFATVSRTFEIPPIPGGRSDEPLDLGLMRLRPRTTLEIGQQAPNVEVATVEGEVISIPADYQGKYLLLDFGAPYEDQSLYQIARVNGLRAKFDDDRLAIVSLIVAEDDAETRTFVAAKGQDWPQAIVGAFPNPVVEAFAIEDHPYGSSVNRLFLIGPDGGVLAKDFYGQEVEKLLTDALPPDNGGR